MRWQDLVRIILGSDLSQKVEVVEEPSNKEIILRVSKMNVDAVEQQWHRALRSRDSLYQSAGYKLEAASAAVAEAPILQKEKTDISPMLLLQDPLKIADNLTHCFPETAGIHKRLNIKAVFEYGTIEDGVLFSPIAEDADMYVIWQKGVQYIAKFLHSATSQQMKDAWLRKAPLPQNMPFDMADEKSVFAECFGTVADKNDSTIGRVYFNYELFHYSILPPVFIQDVKLNEQEKQEKQEDKVELRFSQQSLLTYLAQLTAEDGRVLWNAKSENDEIIFQPLLIGKQSAAVQMKRMIYFLVDTSGSMAKDLGEVKRYFKDLITGLRRLDGESKVKLISFNDMTSWIFEKNELDIHDARIEKSIDSLSADGRTRLNGTLADVFDDIRQQNLLNMHDVTIILLTDGVDYSSENSEEAFKTSLANIKALPNVSRLMTFNLGLGREFDAAKLGHIAEVTQGKMQALKTTADLACVYDYIGQIKLGRDLVEFCYQNNGLVITKVVSVPRRDLIEVADITVGSGTCVSINGKEQRITGMPPQLAQEEQVAVTEKDYFDFDNAESEQPLEMYKGFDASFVGAVSAALSVMFFKRQKQDALFSSQDSQLLRNPGFSSIWVSRFFKSGIPLFSKSEWQQTVDVKSTDVQPPVTDFSGEVITPK